MQTVVIQLFTFVVWMCVETIMLGSLSRYAQDNFDFDYLSLPCTYIQCRLYYWQSNGDYLCAQVTRHSRTGLTEFTNFELCRIRGTNYPMEVLGVETRVWFSTFRDCLLCLTVWSVSCALSWVDFVSLHVKFFSICSSFAPIPATTLCYK